MPLIAADLARLESMMPAARELANTRKTKMRLIKLTNRVDVEDNRTISRAQRRPQGRFSPT